MPEEKKFKKIKSDTKYNEGEENPMEVEKEQENALEEPTRMAKKNEDEINKYLTSDRGPFFVMLEKPGINLIHAAKTLNQAGFRDIIDIRASGKNRVRIHFKNAIAANKLINTHKFVKDKDLKIFAPKMYTQSIGVITGVPVDYEMAELEENIHAECKIIKVERITRWDHVNQKSIPTTAVKIWFRQNVLPNAVQFYLANVKVRYFIPNPIMCKKCLRYGHTKNVCRDEQETCKNCATIHAGVCNNNTSCKHCKEDHKTTDKRCKEYKKQQQIKKIMTIKKVTYPQALKEVMDSGNFPTSYPNNQDKQKEHIEKLNGEIMKTKNILGACQGVLNNIHQITSHYGDDSAMTNDLMLIEIINVLRKASESSFSE